ncbi:hypothetical protein G7062_01155 [Erysipelothrix sp. HDW6C]|uniref:hypothetical protein n=1 Tax=Erysipelothrix sp. HDW6C TaxID=2714930 RepID=UPI001409F7FD|nr:hypothetical protein [Erysipelothrix sp. HDW6C]QIK68973.1 hypothetical protein G7062_01155 [Erysipelothrix sp. HDW6C]
MRRSFNKIWIPVLLVIVGITLTSVAVGGVTRQIYEQLNFNETITGNFVENTQPLDASITDINIYADATNSINIVFDDSQTPSLKTVGESTDLVVRTSGESLTIKTSESLCNGNILSCNNPRFDTIALVLPTSMKGSIRIEALVQNVSIDAKSIQTLDRVVVKTLNTAVKVNNIEGSLKFDTLNLTLDAQNVAGNIDINGADVNATIVGNKNKLAINSNTLNMSANVSSMGDLTLDTDGLNVNVIAIVQEKSGYSVRMTGLSSSYSNLIGSNSNSRLFGDIRDHFTTSEGNQNISISMDGLNQSLTLTH